MSVSSLQSEVSKRQESINAYKKDALVSCFIPMHSRPFPNGKAKSILYFVNNCFTNLLAHVF